MVWLGVGGILRLTEIPKSLNSQISNQNNTFAYANASEPGE
jgi:hypothetical protein